MVYSFIALKPGDGPLRFQRKLIPEDVHFKPPQTAKLHPALPPQRQFSSPGQPEGQPPPQGMWLAQNLGNQPPTPKIDAPIFKNRTQMDLQKKWECSKCRKTFKTKGTLKRHEITHGQAAKVKCEVCGKISKNSFSLASHMRKQHTNLQRPSCDTCHRVFSGATSLRCHTETSHSTKERSRFPCPFPGCEKTYPSQGGLWQHVKKEHGQNPVQFPCTLCGKEFKRRAELVQHIPTHTKEKPHNCAICGKSFARRTGLKSHEVTHLEKSTRDMLQCHVCPQTFITRQEILQLIKLKRSRPGETYLEYRADPFLRQMRVQEPLESLFNQTQNTSQSSEP
ncbi:Zinc finger imprinted 3 [Folsomia candida]|uniref:Zinc finger imprinted 3 n=1 Tax=Folsomia candida TaxID=158441 RepID=A0A226DIC6_FOLCA|nr:Zinc finger imprinted 3 [Folsomia candida]